MKHNREISLWLISLLMFISLLGFTQQQYLFIENKGQFPDFVLSKVKIPNGAIFIQKGKLTYAFYDGDQVQDNHNLVRNDNWIDAHSVTMEFLNSNEKLNYKLSNKSHYFENYYNNNKWATNVYSYQKFYNKNIYSGIDLQMYSHFGTLKYDLIIHPKSSTKKIKLKYSGHDDIFLKDGNLILKTSINQIKELAPYAYQIINEKKVNIKCNFKLRNNILTFDFPEGYDKNKKLIIDPVLIFSTYSGSTADNFGYTATYDRLGFLYSGSTVFGVGYPTTLGAYQINYANNNGGTDIAITKYDTTGTMRIYSTYLGGSMDELPHSMIVNNLNELFIFGTTGSDNYPTTIGCYNNTFSGGNGFSPGGLGVSFPNGSDIIISRLSSDGGDLLSSTYLGGSGNDGLNTSQKLRKNYADEVRGEIDIDKNNNIYLATSTYSTDFPIINSFQQVNNGSQEACIIKMDNQLSTIIWSSYLGGSKDDAIYSLAIDKNDNVFVTGGTTSDDFPISSNAYLNSFQDSINADAFITHISSDGSLIINSSYFGSEFYDQSYFVELNSDEEVYIFGQTKALSNSLVMNANYFTLNANQFISVFSNDLSQLLRSTVFGTGKGTPDISPTAFLVDVCNNIYISGWGSSTGNGTLSTINMPITLNAFQNNTDGNDFYIMIIDDNLDSLVYGTYFGGSQSAEHVDGGTSRFDKKGIIYQSVCAGCGMNNDFPIEPNPGAVSTTNNSTNCNNGVFKFDFNFPIIISDFDAPWVGCNNNITFTNLSNSTTNTSYFWDFGDGTTSVQTSPTHQYLSPGIYNITLIASSTNACNFSDTISKQIYILSNSSNYLQSFEVCKDEPIQIGILPINDPSITYSWSPSFGLSNSNIPNPIVSIDITTQFELIISDGICADTIYQLVTVDSININASEDTAFCKDPILLLGNISGDVNSIIWSTNNNFLDTISISSFYTANSPGTYYILVSNNNCLDIDSINVTNDNINIEISGITEICKGDSVFIKVDDLSSLDPIISYEWISEYELFFGLDSSTFISYPENSTWYKVIVTNTIGCIVYDSIFVEVYNVPYFDSIWASSYSIFLGETTDLNIATNNNVLWSTNDNTNTITISPEYSSQYQVIIYNEFCQIEDSIYIEVKDVFCDKNRIVIPNAFTPNEDGKNDFYRIDDLDGVITHFKLEVFNRFGQKVFSSNDINNSWDGYHNGELLSSQVFDYYLEIQCIGEKKLFQKGNITLVR